MAIHDLRLTRHATVNKTHMIKAKKKKTVQTKVKKTEMITGALER